MQFVGINFAAQMLTCKISSNSVFFKIYPAFKLEVSHSKIKKRLTKIARDIEQNTKLHIEGIHKGTVQTKIILHVSDQNVNLPPRSQNRYMQDETIIPWQLSFNVYYIFEPDIESSILPASPLPFCHMPRQWLPGNGLQNVTSNIFMLIPYRTQQNVARGRIFVGVVFWIINIDKCARITQLWKCIFGESVPANLTIT